MSENTPVDKPFDPYYEWLSIPESQQPPTHYRLLGVENFESNPKVIANAADRAMVFIRTFQAGQHSGESQRVLNEIAAARVCLLNEKSKREYDAGLRWSLTGGDAAAVSPPPESDVSPTPAVEFRPTHSVTIELPDIPLRQIDEADEQGVIPKQWHEERRSKQRWSQQSPLHPPQLVDIPADELPPEPALPPKAKKEKSPRQPSKPFPFRVVFTTLGVVLLLVGMLILLNKFGGNEVYLRKSEVVNDIDDPQSPTMEIIEEEPSPGELALKKIQENEELAKRLRLSPDGTSANPHPRVTDADLSHLTTLPQLHHLKLNACTSLTNTGLMSLKDSEQLTSIEISGGYDNIASGGILALKRCIPSCEIRIADKLNLSEELTTITELRLPPDIVDLDLEHLKGLTQLKSLYLDGTQVTWGAIIELKKYLPNCAIKKGDFGFSKPAELRLPSSAVDADLVHLKGLTQLKRLDLEGTQVTDAGLVHLKGLTQLEWLDLVGTQITDVGLVHLKGLTQLETLGLYDTQVTDAGLAELKKVLPNCGIYR